MLLGMAQTSHKMASEFHWRKQVEVQENTRDHYSKELLFHFYVGPPEPAQTVRTGRKMTPLRGQKMTQISGPFFGLR